MTKQELQRIFSERFRSLRFPDESQVEFAKRLEISRPTVAQYENGKRIADSDILVQICSKCSVSADWLLGLSDIQTSSEDVIAACKTLHITEETAKSIIYLQGLVDSLTPVDYLFELGDDLKVPFAYLAQYHMIRGIHPKNITGIPNTPLIDLNGSVRLSPDNAARYFIQEFCSTLQSLLSYDLLKQALDIDDIEGNEE